MFLNRFSRQKLPSFLRHLSTSSNPNPRNPNSIPRNPNSNPRNPNPNPRDSKLHSKYTFKPPPTFTPPNPNNPNPNPNTPPEKPKKPRYKPPSSLYRKPPIQSRLPFDFRYSYTEPTKTRPIGLRQPRYSPFGPGRLDREWTGVVAPVKAPIITSIDGDGDKGERLSAVELVTEEDQELVMKRKAIRESIQGVALTKDEIKVLVDVYIRGGTKRQINLGRDGLTHNMLDEIHCHWKRAEAVRIKCMGLATVDMENVCAQLEDKTFGKIIYRRCGILVLYRGRNYEHVKRPVIPLMIWKPAAPVYPKAVTSTVGGLNGQESKEIRQIGLTVPALTRLGRNKYYGNLVAMVRDAFLVAPLVRIDCTDLDKNDLRKIGVRLRDLVPCTLVSFMKEQIVIWNGENYKPREDTSEEKEKPEERPKTIDDLVWD